MSSTRKGPIVGSQFIGPRKKAGSGGGGGIDCNQLPTCPDWQALVSQVEDLATDVGTLDAALTVAQQQIADNEADILALETRVADLEALVLPVTPPGPGWTSTQAFEFNGVDSEMFSVRDSFASRFSALKGWAISLWVNVDTPTNSSDYTPLVMNRGVNENAYSGIYVDLRNSSGRRVLAQPRAAGLSANAVSGPIAYTSGQWQHILVHFNRTSSVIEIWVDGAISGTPATFNPTSEINMGNAAPWAVGCYNAFDAAAVGDYLPFGSLSPGSPGLGYMSDIAFYGDELTVAEIGAIYNGGTPPDLLSLPSAPKLSTWLTGNDPLDTGKRVLDRADGTQLAPRNDFNGININLVAR